MRDAAAAGLGLALLPTFFLHAARGSRSLKVIDIGAEAEGAEIFVAYPEDLRSAPKIEALTEWLRQAFGEPPYWDRAGKTGEIGCRKRSAPHVRGVQNQLHSRPSSLNSLMLTLCRTGFALRKA
jgi:hypothetical protein